MVLRRPRHDADNTNTYTGNTLMSSTVGTLTLSGNGSISRVRANDFAGAVNLSNTATNLNDRLSDTAGITMHGAALNVLGNASAATSETVGANDFGKWQ